MIKIGILGDIGSGKSYVAKSFGYPVFNADYEVAKLYKKNKKIFVKLKKILPKNIKSFTIEKKEITENFLNNKNVYFYSLISSGVPIGFFILDYRKKEICDISYIGLTKGNLGKGLGKYLFKTAFLMGWDTNYINKLTYSEY